MPAIVADAARLPFADQSVDLIVADPPYMGVIDAEWDNQWKTAGDFIAWLDTCLVEWRRVLKPNGSLYVFAGPRMAARVEVAVAERFTVLNHLVWHKRIGNHQRTDRDGQRMFHPASSERIVFAEVPGADGSALQGSGYAAEVSGLRAGVFEPLRAYLVGERDRAGVTNRQVDAALGTNGMAGHYFGASQWMLPTATVYEQLRQLFNRDGGTEFLRREYEFLRREYEDLRREYEDLRRDYEDLRRPFTVGDRANGDVWEFNLPKRRDRHGHPCSKPVDLIEHIVLTSSRPGGVVLDPFCGSGPVAEACVRTGRQYLGTDLDPHWVQVTNAREQATVDAQAGRLFAA